MLVFENKTYTKYIGYRKNYPLKRNDKGLES
jgi:hypothetical protein